jgi:hypothetical protein
MTSTRPVRSIVLLGTCLCGLSACTSVLLNTPVSKTGDGWSITLSEVKEGPDEYVGEVSTIIPEEGEKFIWTLVTVKNDGAQEQTFAYETCMLQGPGVSRPPAILDRHAELQHSAADPEEAYEPGVQRVRELIYKFPKAQRPTRMKCGTIVLPIPTKK